MTDLDRDLTAIKTGQLAGAAADLIAQALDRREAATERRIYQMLDGEQPLDPQRAMQAWVEKHEIFKLRQSLLQRERMGQSAARRAGSAMEG